MGKYNGYRPQRSFREYIAPIVLVLLVGGCMGYMSYQQRESPAEKRERLEAAPERACEAMLRDARRDNDGEELLDWTEGADRSDLRYEEDLQEYALDQLEGADTELAEALQGYRDTYEHGRAPVAAGGDAREAASPSHDAYVEAAHECADVGYPVWLEYMHDETGNDEWLPY